LKHNLSSSDAQWKLIGNSVMITPVDFRQPLPPEILAQLGLMTGVPFNVDSWDGYTDDRRELLDHIATNGINNVAFLTGDTHSSWACDVPRGPGSTPSVAVELVGTSITSDNLNEIFGVPPRSAFSIQVETVFKAGNPHIKYLEFDSHGYSVVDVTPERMQMDWYYISDRADVNATQQFGAAFRVPTGANAVQPAAGPLGARV
jgi:alkaline phosphatase D